MITPINILNVAKTLSLYAEEEFIRSAISRIYFAFFVCARKYLIENRKKYYLAQPNVNVHSVVYNELINSNDSTENDLGEFIENLRKLRNEADYDIGKFDLDYFNQQLTTIYENIDENFNALMSLWNDYTGGI